MSQRPGRARLLAIVRQCLGRMRGSIVLAAAGLVGVACAELAGPWPLKIIFDHILLAKPLAGHLEFVAPLVSLGAWPALAAMAGAIAGIALLLGSCAYLQSYLTAKIGHMVVYRLRGALFSHLQRLSLLFHHRAVGRAHQRGGKRHQPAARRIRRLGPQLRGAPRDDAGDARRDVHAQLAAHPGRCS